MARLLIILKQLTMIEYSFLSTFKYKDYDYQI